jgi:hypothetical protein
VRAVPACLDSCFGDEQPDAANKKTPLATTAFREMFIGNPFRGLVNVGQRGG